MNNLIKLRMPDPREMKEKMGETKGKKKEVLRSERSDLENMEYFRQKEAAFTAKGLDSNEVDMAIQYLMVEVADALAADLKVGTTKRQ